jgi:hypothetical protein
MNQKYNNNNNNNNNKYAVYIYCVRKKIEAASDVRISILKLYRPNGPPISRYMHKFTAEKHKAMLPRYRRGYLK